MASCNFRSPYKERKNSDFGIKVLGWQATSVRRLRRGDVPVVSREFRGDGKFAVIC
jgi:hypothetical protein